MTSVLSYIRRVPRGVAVAIAILCGVLLTADYWYEVFNGAHIDTALTVRKAKSEEVANDVVPLLKSGDAKTLGQRLDARVTDDPSIRSVGVRRASGQVHLETARHREEWRHLENGKSTMTHVQVPIYAGRDLWGYVEVSYRQPVPDSADWLVQPKIIALYGLLFLSLAHCLLVSGRPARLPNDAP